MKAIVCVGISASGKTTWAREHAKKTGAVIICRDDLRFAITGAKDWSEYKFNKKIEQLVTDMQFSMARDACVVGRDVIIADTNLNPDIRNRWHSWATVVGYETEVKPFPITLEEAWKRDGLRANGVGRDIIYKQWQQWLKFIERRTYNPDETLPKAICFDIDGTLAHMNGRKPYDWDKVGTDVVDPIVQQIFWDFQKRGYKMVVLSGRDSVCREQTYTWLVDNGFIFDELLMRPEGDCRKDTIVKEEIFWRDVAPCYNVQAVVDDRPVVCRMWRDLGLKVVMVGDPHEEF